MRHSFPVETTPTKDRIIEAAIEVLANRGYSSAGVQEIIDKEGFLEWASFSNNFYGTPKKIVKEKIEKGTNVLLEIELEGARQIRKSFPEALQIFLAPPNLSELEKRIRGRGTETEEAIRDRLAIANKELFAKKEFDAVVINEDIEKAFMEIEGLMGLKLKPN